MIAAIYCRKSTEEHVADEQKSVARQVEHARQYARRKGWTVDEAYVFVDEGISGAEFANRPGYRRLMAAAAQKPRPPFQVLIMSEESRLGREAIETAYALKQLVTAGVRVFFYLEDRERTLDSPTDKVMLSLTAYADELEREKARQRTYDAMVRKARAGEVTGGRCFGYTNVDATGREVVPGVSRAHHRIICEPEAAVVRRIFALAAAGIGQARIAKTLNAEGVPTPRPQQRRPAGWAPASVHAVLFRALYRGEIVWSRTRKRNQWGVKAVSDRPAYEWLRVPAEHLRIVPEALWQAAHARITTARGLYRDATKGLRGGRPRIESKYLLPGLARCACCNGGLLVRTGNHGTGDRRVRAYEYACSANHNRGATVCANRVAVSMDAVDAEVVAAFHDDVLTPDLVPDIVARLQQLVEARPPDPRERARDELAAVERQIANLAASIELGGNLPALVARLQAASARQQALQQELGTGTVDDVRVGRVDWRAIERHAKRRLTDWRSLLTRQMSDARLALRELLQGEPLRFIPIADGTRRGYRFEGYAVIGGLLEGVIVDQWQGASPPGLGRALVARRRLTGEYVMRVA